MVACMYWERDTKQVKKEENEEEYFVHILSFRMQHRLDFLQL